LFRLGLPEDRDIRVRILPELEEILVSSPCLGLFSEQRKRSAELQVRERAYGITDDDSAAVDNLLEFRGCFRAPMCAGILPAV